MSKAKDYTLSYSAGCMAAKDDSLVPDRGSTVSLATQESTFCNNTDKENGSSLLPHRMD